MESETSTYVDKQHEARETYRADGFKLVRIEPGAKQSYDEGWSGKDYAPDFGPNDSTGIHWGEYSGWRVDVEADVPEGIPVLKRFLGDTLRFGRPGALGSHNVTRAVGSTTKKFKGTNGEILIELRSTGTQSVVLPSEHEQGARVWEKEYDPAKIKEFEAAELARVVTQAAAATLIARNMPDGGRHDWCLALAGYLVPRIGDDRTYDVLDVAWEVAGAYTEGKTVGEVRDAVYDTAEALDRSENVTGGPTLDETSPGVVKLLSKWLDPKLYVPTEAEIREKRKAAEKVWPECAALAHERDILSETYKALEADGLVGEETNAKLLGLSAVSTRHLGESLSRLGDGTSSSGKSEVIKRVVKTLPEEFYIERRSVSDKALAYMGDELKRMILVVYELSGLGQKGSDGLEMAKQLLTEGKISRQIAESIINKGVRGRHTLVEGPTSLWTTTTRNFTDHELRTRLFFFRPDDSQDQTRKIVAGIFSEDRTPVDFGPFKALHTWFEAQDNRVTIPFGGELAKNMVSSAVRLRRDAARLKNLISAHAVLHQATRERDSEGRIVATLEDYAAVRALVDNMIGVAAEQSVNPTVRETVEAVQKVDPITAKNLKTKITMSIENARKRLRDAEEAGYLKLDPECGREHHYLLDGTLPHDMPALPTPETLEAGMRASKNVPRRGEETGAENTCPDDARLDARGDARIEYVPPFEESIDYRYKEFSGEEPTEEEGPTGVGISVTGCPDATENPTSTEAVMPANPKTGLTKPMHTSIASSHRLRGTSVNTPASVASHSPHLPGSPTPRRRHARYSSTSPWCTRWRDVISPSPPNPCEQP